MSHQTTMVMIFGALSMAAVPTLAFLPFHLAHQHQNVHSLGRNHGGPGGRPLASSTLNSGDSIGMDVSECGIDEDEEGCDDPTAFLVGILGDLHIDPRKMDHYTDGRNHWLPILEQAKTAHGNAVLCSLGDLGESKNCDHNPSNPAELYAGTTLCHEQAATFLGSFGVPYEGKNDTSGRFRRRLTTVAWSNTTLTFSYWRKS
jgi:hypothetical protein